MNNPAKSSPLVWKARELCELLDAIDERQVTDEPVIVVCDMAAYTRLQNVLGKHRITGWSKLYLTKSFYPIAILPPREKLDPLPFLETFIAHQSIEPSWRAEMIERFVGDNWLPLWLTDLGRGRSITLAGELSRIRMEQL